MVTLLPKQKDYFSDSIHKTDKGLEHMGRLAAQGLMADPGIRGILAGDQN